MLTVSLGHVEETCTKTGFNNFGNGKFIKLLFKNLAKLNNLNKIFVPIFHIFKVK